jgi:iron complex outermembrane receptor protein
VDQYGGNIRGVWDHEISDTSATKLQTYLNINSYTIPDRQVDFRLDWNLFDIDFQHNFDLYEDNTFLWGAGYRHGDFSSRASERISYIPGTRDVDVVSWFIQDSIPLIEDKLKGILGVKMEHNDFTGFEYQPTARLAYQYNERQMFWAAYSRAIRTPNHSNRDVFFNQIVGPPPTVSTVTGDKDIVSERINSYEAGWRSLISDKLTLDLTGYVMRGKNMVDIGGVSPLELQFNNDIKANTEGVEVAVDWQASETWRLKGTYSWFHMDISSGNETFEDNTPQNMFSINSFKNISKEIELNTNVFFQDEIRTSPGSEVSSWVRLDSGLVWHVNKNMEVGLWGQNLLDDRHQEFKPMRIINSGGSEVPRSVFLEMTYKF